MVNKKVKIKKSKKDSDDSKQQSTYFVFKDGLVFLGKANSKPEVIDIIEEFKETYFITSEDLMKSIVINEVIILNDYKVNVMYDLKKI